VSDYSLEVTRTDLGKTQTLDLPAREGVQLAEGEVLLSVDRFALTANNITYGVAGDLIGYWQFFPAEGDWGRIPVWGVGTVIASKNAGLDVGQRYYGYYPMSSYLVVKPEGVSGRGFTDGADHRAALPPVYNNYALMNPENGFDPAHDDHQMVYRPLFTTSFVIDDYLDDNDFFGAKTVILSSASSKTSFGLAFLLHRNRDVKVIGLTSTSNVAFVESLGLYDQVVTYEDIDSLDANIPAAFVDMAGNRGVLENLHRHFQDNMVCSCGVGITHWEARDGAEPASLPGAKPTMFFAPSQIQKRNQDWGPEKFQRELANAWVQFLEVVDDWVTINHPAGADGMRDTYQTVLAGAKPDQSYVVSVQSLR
jgi:hypothetical protein